LKNLFTKKIQPWRTLNYLDISFVENISLIPHWLADTKISLVEPVVVGEKRGGLQVVVFDCLHQLGVILYSSLFLTLLWNFIKALIFYTRFVSLWVLNSVEDPDPYPYFLGLLDPDLLVRGADPDPDPSIIKQK
jgi:hypothetical protein